MRLERHAKELNLTLKVMTCEREESVMVSWVFSKRFPQLPCSGWTRDGARLVTQRPVGRLLSSSMFDEDLS